MKHNKLAFGLAEYLQVNTASMECGEVKYQTSASMHNYNSSAYIREYLKKPIKTEGSEVCNVW